MNIEIRSVEKLADIGACHAVMMELRPHLEDTDKFIQQVVRQREQQFRLSAAWHDGRVVGVVGYRLQENLLYGPFVYVDDLVVRKEYRNDGIGAQLLSAARTYAQEMGCRHFVLATGLDMSLAQRFYFRQGLLAHGMCFSEALFAPEFEHHADDMQLASQASILNGHGV